MLVRGVTVLLGTIFVAIRSQAPADINVEWCSEGMAHEMHLSDFIGDLSQARDLKFEYSDGIRKVEAMGVHGDNNEEEEHDQANKDVVHVSFRHQSGTHNLVVSYINNTEVEGSDGKTRTTVCIAIRQLKCKEAVVFPERLNDTHAKVHCGLPVEGEYASVTWTINGLHAPVSTGRKVFVFGIEDEREVGLHTCSQTFLGDIDTKTTERFYVGHPGEVRIGEVKCRVKGMLIGAGGKSRGVCYQPEVEVFYDPTKPENTNLMAFHVTYTPREGTPFNTTTYVGIGGFGMGRQTSVELRTVFYIPGVLSIRAKNSYGLEGPIAEKIILS